MKGSERSANRSGSKKSINPFYKCDTFGYTLRDTRYWLHPSSASLFSRQRYLLLLLLYFYLSIYTASPSLLSIMCRAVWGGGKPGHISAFPGYACETIAAKPHIPTDFFPYKYFVPGWTRTRTEEVCSSVVKYSASTEWAIPAPWIILVPFVIIPNSIWPTNQYFSCVWHSLTKTKHVQKQITLHFV